MGDFHADASGKLFFLRDTLTRMHAATKAGTLGTGLILIAVATFYQEIGITLRSLVAIVFLLLTAPVAAHLIGRAAYYTGIKLWKKTWINQLKDVYPQRRKREGPKKKIDRKNSINTILN